MCSHPITAVRRIRSVRHARTTLVVKHARANKNEKIIIKRAKSASRGDDTQVEGDEENVGDHVDDVFMITMTVKMVVEVVMVATEQRIRGR